MSSLRSQVNLRLQQAANEIEILRAAERPLAQRSAADAAVLFLQLSYRAHLADLLQQYRLPASIHPDARHAVKSLREERDVPELRELARLEEEGIRELGFLSHRYLDPQGSAAIPSLSFDDLFKCYQWFKALIEKHREVSREE